MYDDDLMPDVPPALGMVLDEGRGSLPYSLVHGEPMVRCAVLGLEEAGVEPLDPDTSWPVVLELLDRVEALVLHDSLCPMTPPAFVVRCVLHAVTTKAVAVGFRPVTDTIKHVRHGSIGATVDRDDLRVLASPVVLPADVVRDLPRPPRHDLSGLVSSLAERGVPIEWIEAPVAARRVSSRDDVRLLEALTAP